MREHKKNFIQEKCVQLKIMLSFVERFLFMIKRLVESTIVCDQSFLCREVKMNKLLRSLNEDFLRETFFQNRTSTKIEFFKKVSNLLPRKLRIFAFSLNRCLQLNVPEQVQI